MDVENLKFPVLLRQFEFEMRLCCLQQSSTTLDFFFLRVRHKAIHYNFFQRMLSTISKTLNYLDTWLLQVLEHQELCWSCYYEMHFTIFCSSLWIHTHVLPTTWLCCKRMYPDTDNPLHHSTRLLSHILQSLLRVATHRK